MKVENYFKALKIEYELAKQLVDEFLDLITKFKDDDKKTKFVKNYQFGIIHSRKLVKKTNSIILMILNFYQLDELILRYNDQFAKINPIESEIHFDDLQFLNEILLPHYWLIEEYYNLLEINFIKSETFEELYKIQQLENILKGTNTLLKDLKVKIERETDIHKIVFPVLKQIFPETSREVAISGPIKSFNADFGIKTISTLIEYKLIKNDKEAKSFLDGILADSKGYSNSKDWNKFYSVLYMNEPYFSESRIIEEYKSKSIHENWIPIITIGGLDYSN